MFRVCKIKEDWEYEEMKQITIKEIKLSVNNVDPCKTCDLKDKDCQAIKSFLKNEYGFTDCGLGVNYKVVKDE